MSSSKTIVRMAGLWLFFLAAYAGASLVLPRGSHALTAFGDLTQCIVPLLANAGLLLNAGTPHWRRNLFWMLLAMGCTLWLIGQFEWTYYELYLHRDVPENDPVDLVFFLRGIPMMAALTLRPHLKRGELRLRFGYLDFALLLTWWIFLYVFIVLPWMYAVPSLSEYKYNFVLLHNIENMIIVGGFYGFRSRTHTLLHGVRTVKQSEMNPTPSRTSHGIGSSVNFNGLANWAISLETEGPRLEVDSAREALQPLAAPGSGMLGGLNSSGSSNVRRIGTSPARALACWERLSLLGSPGRTRASSRARVQGRRSRGHRSGRSCRGRSTSRPASAGG